jgi:L-alanine-DL-glutamate epimerase-like enolase superfamily enzyme
VQLATERVVHRLRTPLRTAWGTLTAREVLRVAITGADGVTGFGEAAPLEPYDGVSIAQVRAILKGYASAIAGADASPGSALLDACREVSELPQALAAVDLALWDRAGRREGKPLALMLADDPLREVPVNATIGAEDRAGAATAAAKAVAEGFRCAKLKVGIGDDAGRVAAVRAAAGPGLELRLDANGAWTVDEAVAAIAMLSPAGLELVEEPVHGIEELRAVRDRVPVRIAMDETAAVPGALASRAADVVCLKISRAGGIGPLLAQASLVRALGGEIYLASTFDGPLGVAAAVHCAAALRVELPCGLATLGAFADGEDELLPVVRGMIAVPTGSGLGL